MVAVPVREHHVFRTFLLIAGIVTSGSSIAFEEIGQPAGEMDYDHVWQPLPVGTVYTTQNNRSGNVGSGTAIEITDATRSYKGTSSTCIVTFPLYMFAPIVARENCGEGPLSSLTQEFWIEGTVFPMKKGQKWRFYTQNLTDKDGKVNSRKQTHRCRVKDEVRVRTVAGEFDTFKVICDPTFEVRTYYYSPEIGHVVAMRQEKPRGTETHNWELVSIEYPN